MSQPLVTIAQGKLRGTVGTDLRGNPFFKFQGIPYAKPPLGNLRFKAPQPPEKWTGIWDATKEGDSCYCRDPLKNMTLAGSEDCLFLNVYTKKLQSSDRDLKPVMVWVHGGGLIWGSGNEELYGPDFLITEDVVLVTFNYRLGLLGFLSFEDPSLDISGNAGLKDQVMALKWVQNNISAFGGDPNNVTIFGESAGGASVHLLVLSPLAKGLFHKAIAQSGSALNPWVEARSNNRLSKALNLEDAGEKAIYNTLMGKSVEEVHEIHEKLTDGFASGRSRAVGVVIEQNSKEPFLDDELINIILSGRYNQVPFIIGYTSAEGMLFDFFQKPSERDSVKTANLIPWSFGYELGTPEIEEVAEEITHFYFESESYPKSLISSRHDLFTDSQFLHGIYETIVTHLKTSKAPIYFYKVTVETDLNFFKKLINPDLPGVSHCDDLGYLFKHLLTPEIKPGSVEDQALTKFVKLWTNFAKFGNPTPEKDDDLLKIVWKPVKSPDLEYLEIGRELKLGTNPDIERINFWKGLFAESLAGRKSIYA